MVVTNAEKRRSREKVAELIQKEVARLLQREFRDPRLAMVTINEVRVSRDYAFFGHIFHGTSRGQF